MTAAEKIAAALALLEEASVELAAERQESGYTTHPPTLYHVNTALNALRQVRP